MSSEKKATNYATVKKIISVAMGLFYIFIGLMLLITKHFGAIALPNTTLSYILGSLMLLYGAFRLYRALTQEAS